MLDVKHYLNIYGTRKQMQNEGITNPSREIKMFTKEFVEKLSSMPIDEEIKLGNYTFFDSKGKLIAKFPVDS